MNTRSVKAIQLSGLSARRAGTEGKVPPSVATSVFGPMAATWRYALDAPGPPLKTKVTGRVAGLPPFSVYATWKISASGCSGSAPIGSMPALAS